MYLTQYDRDRSALQDVLKRPGGWNTRVGPSGAKEYVGIRHPAQSATDTEHATIVEEGPRWKGPFVKYDCYGDQTGARFVRCTGCGVEVLQNDTVHAIQRDGCDGLEE